MTIECPQCGEAMWLNNVPRETALKFVGCRKCEVVWAVEVQVTISIERVSLAPITREANADSTAP